MSDIWGADIAELQQLAVRFDQSASTLDNIRGGVTSLFRAVDWSGHDADMVRSQWQQRDIPALTAAATMLRDGATTLNKAAQLQQNASSAAGGAIGTGVSLIGLLKTLWNDVTQAAGWAGGPGLSQLKAEMGQSPAAQLAWWSSLTPAQRESLIYFEPNTLLTLQGLPADVRAQASQNAVASLESTIQMGGVTQSVSAGATVKFVSLGVNGQMAETTYADGHATVTITAGGDLGAGLGVPEAGIGLDAHGEGSATYTFDNPADAQAFEAKLASAATPHVSASPWDILAAASGPVGLLAVGGASLASVPSNISNVLSSYQGNFQSTSISGYLNDTANLTMPGVEGASNQGSIQIQAGDGVTQNLTTGQTTAFVEIKGAAQGSLGPFDGAATADGKAAITFGPDHQVQTLNITGSYSAATGTDPTGSPIEQLSGTTGTYQMNVDLSDPANRALALQFLRDNASGDSSGAAQALAQLNNNSEIVVQTGNEQVQTGGFNVVVASGGATVTTTTPTSTWVKPAGGDFTQLPAKTP